MKKKYLNKEVTTIYEGLNSLRKSDIKFPAKVGYAIVRNLKILSPIYEDIIIAREMLLSENGTQVEGENYYEIAPEKKDFVMKELDSLGRAENEITLTKIKMADIEKLDLPIEIMEGLFCMIEEDEGE